MSETMTERRANERWGEHPMEWPLPPHSRPRWWQFRTRRTLADLEAVFGHLDNAALRRWWVELRKGQSVYEDAGGYLLRCYEAMAGREGRGTLHIRRCRRRHPQRTDPMTDTAALREAAVKATQGEWTVWTEHTPSKDRAIDELAHQVLLVPDADFAEAVYMLNADGKCPALTGCGPTSKDNAAYLVAAQPKVILSLLDELDRLRASPAPDSAASKPREPEETGWLVEFKGQRPLWWALGATDGEGGYMTGDSTKALRFAREEDANAYIDDAGWTEAFASEHGWADPRPASPAPDRVSVKPLPEAFVTSQSGDGEYAVHIKCQTMSDMHQWHDAVLDAYRSAISEASKPPELVHDGWFVLEGDARLGECATHGCGGQPTWRHEAYGVGANYCAGCRAKIMRSEAEQVSGEGLREYLKLAYLGDCKCGQCQLVPASVIEEYATALTTAEARIQELEAALRELEDTLTPAEQVPPKDPAYGDEVRALGLRIGFGALMASASHEWRQWLADNGYPLGSEFVAGPCRAVLESDLRAARHTLRRGK